MIQITAQMRVLVAIEPVDGRKGIDSLARLCQEEARRDPVFRMRVRVSQPQRDSDPAPHLRRPRILAGAEAAVQRKFSWWPEAAEACQTAGGVRGAVADGRGRSSRVRAAPMWRRVTAPEIAFCPCVPRKTGSYYGAMATLRYRGREIHPEDILFIRELIEQHSAATAAASFRRGCARPGTGGSPTAPCATWCAAACC